jgi:putative transposase
MANSYSQGHVHIVFAVKHRKALIQPTFQERLHRYMTGIVQGQGHKLVAINSMPDHIHLLVGLRQHQAGADFMRILKSDSSEWINKEKLCDKRFQWQGGYGWFHFGRERLDQLISYVMHQEEHHKKQNFRQEFIMLLDDQGVEYDMRYIFKDPE